MVQMPQLGHGRIGAEPAPAAVAVLIQRRQQPLLPAHGKCILLCHAVLCHKRYLVRLQPLQSDRFIRGNP